MKGPVFVLVTLDPFPGDDEAMLLLEALMIDRVGDDSLSWWDGRNKVRVNLFLELLENTTS